MYNSQEIVFEGRTGSFNIMGNSNSIHIMGSRVQLIITGNSNMIMVAGSQVKIQIVGNSNHLQCSESQANISLIGNSNIVGGLASQLNFSGVMGTGNQIPNAREERRREQQPRQRNQQRRRRESAQREPQMPQQIGTYALPFMYSAMSQLSNMFGFGRPNVPAHQPEEPRRNRIFAFQEQPHGDVNRRIFRIGSDESEEDQGLNTTQLGRLPKTKNNGSKIVNCSVCMQNIRHGQYQTYLFCFHNFHSECIERWLAKKRQCPVCQLNIREHLVNE